MSEKKLLAININEFNLKFLINGAKKYNCSHIKKILKLKKVNTYSVDKIQDKNLDPWVQNVSINSGKRSSVHRIFNLGQQVPNNINQIWDYLSKNKIKCGVWGPMNTNFKNNKNIEIFFPDPWNQKSITKPLRLNKIYNLCEAYAKNYTDFKLLKNVKYFFQFFLFLLRPNYIIDILRLSPTIFRFLIKNGIKNYFLFFLFDIISLIIFKNLSKNKNLNFSLLFLNSLAHFQHNNWDEKENYRDYFIFTELIFKLLFKISKNYKTILIYNSFSQEKIKSQYLIRPKNPDNFFKSMNIEFTKLHSNMTNGFILSFKNKKIYESNFKKIKNINICGFALFEIKALYKNQLFCRIQIKSRKDFSMMNTNCFNVKKNLFYELKSKKVFKTNSYDIYKFLNSFAFIKTTSKHVPNGVIFYKNLKIKEKNIENVKIFSLIKSHFNCL